MWTPDLSQVSAGMLTAAAHTQHNSEVSAVTVKTQLTMVRVCKRYRTIECEADSPASNGEEDREKHLVKESVTSR